MLDKIKDLYYRAVSYVECKRGQTLVEYALLLVLIALVVIVVVRGLGQKVNSVYSTINSNLTP